MTIVVHTVANQDAVARRLIQGSEGSNLAIPTNVGDHTVTLGFGFTMIRRGIAGAWSVLRTLSQDLATVGIALTAAQNAQLEAIATALTAGNTAQADTLITQLRSGWTAAPITEAQAETLFGTELERAKSAVKAQFRSNLSTVEDGNSLYIALENTREMAGLLSLAYNAPTLIGRGLTNALWRGDRAEAWFQIRYESNSASQAANIRAGLAKRRFAEAQYIGPFADPANPTPNEVHNVFLMLQKHREAIMSYEGKFGVPPNGLAATSGNRIAMANADLGAAVAFAGIGQIPTLVEALNPAKAALLTDLRTTNPDLVTKLQDAQWISTNIYLNGNAGGTLDSSAYQTGSFTNGTEDLMVGGTGKDILKGNKGHDLLIGNSGNDTLEGGEGNDILVGGADVDILDGGDGLDELRGGDGVDTLKGGAVYDTYYFNANEGEDKIEDSDGQGQLRLAGNQLKGVSDITKYEVKNGIASWKDDAGITYSFKDGKASKVELTIDGGTLGSGEITIKDFDLDKAKTDEGYLGC